MTRALLPVELWQEIKPILPAPKSRHFCFPGRKPLSGRKVLVGILFVLKTAIAARRMVAAWRSCIG